MGSPSSPSCQPRRDVLSCPGRGAPAGMCCCAALSPCTPANLVRSLPAVSHGLEITSASPAAVQMMIGLVNILFIKQYYFTSLKVLLRGCFWSNCIDSKLYTFTMDVWEFFHSGRYLFLYKIGVAGSILEQGQDSKVPQSTWASPSMYPPQCFAGPGRREQWGEALAQVF